jgi:methionyl-tRNA formyltransferase
MKFIIMTNPGLDNKVVSELINSKLIPTIIVTDSPFYCENKNPLKYIIKKTLLIIKYIKNRNQIKSKYQAYFLAKKYSIKLYSSQKVNSDDFVNLIKKNDIEYIFTFSFKILKEKIFTASKYGSINFHPALLPMNRGTSPSNWSVLQNQKITGITFHFIDKGIDTGPIIEQYEFNLSGYETAKILNEFLLSIGSLLLTRLIYKLDYGIKYDIKTNNSSNGSYEPPFRKEHRIISEKNTFEEIDSIIRASRIVEFGAIFRLEDIDYVIINCINITAIEIPVFESPFLDSKNNIVIKTKDNIIAALITKDSDSKSVSGLAIRKGLQS